MDRPSNIQQSREAAKHRVRLCLGLESVSDVIAWADSQIAQQDAPSSELIDLALAGSQDRHDVAKRLAAMASEQDGEAALGEVLREVADGLRRELLPLQTTVHMFYEYAATQSVPEPLSGMISQFDGELDMIECGYCYYGAANKQEALQLLQNDLLRFLDEYVASRQC